MINKIYSNKGFQIALPWILLFAGLGLIAYSTFGTFQSNENKDLVKSIGNAILIGGIFAVLLKSIQFIGIFKEELSKLIYEPKALGNRVDLPEIWEKMSTVLFKNKFPRISDKLLKDVKEKYFPTTEVSYYENAEHEIDIKVTDKEQKILLITCKVTLDVICENASTKTFYEFGYLKKNGNYKLKKMIISGKDCSLHQPSEKNVNNEIFENYNIKLSGSEKHRIEKTFERTMSLNEDGLYIFMAKKMFHKLKVQIHHESDIKLELKKMGTISDFNTKKDKPLFKEYLCEGLVYPEQGYLINLKIN
jgi:hypothetical protein